MLFSVVDLEDCLDFCDWYERLEFVEGDFTAELLAFGLLLVLDVVVAEDFVEVF